MFKKLIKFLCSLVGWCVAIQGRRQKIFQGGPTIKRPKISKKYRKIALFSLFQGGGQRKKRPKNSKKRPKNSAFKPLSTIFVPWLKIQEGHPPLLTPMSLSALQEKSNAWLLDSPIQLLKTCKDVSQKWHGCGDYKQVIGAVHNIHNIRSQSGERRACPVRTFCGQRVRRFFRCGRPHFLVQKTSNFSKFMSCPHGQGRERLSQLGHLWTRGRWSIFHDFVRTSFMDGSLAFLYTDML